MKTGDRETLNPSRITMRPVHELLAYENNARTHSGHQIDQIAASITEFGWTNPLIIHGDTVVAGHARLDVAKSIGMERPIRNHGDREDAVYDPFLGSGTTLIAAERQQRKGYFIEIDPNYVDVSVKRWENYTGEKAERDPVIVS